MSLLQMSIFGAIMILAVIIIRAIAINRLPKKTFIALWGIVVVRLLIPFSLPSPFSAYSLVNQHIPAAQGAVGLGHTNIAPAPLAGLPAVGDVVYRQAAVSFSPYTIIWGIGLIACALFFAVSYIKCRREFRESLPIKNDFLTLWIAEHKLSRQIEIRQSGRIFAPLTYGVFKPVILMPKNTRWEDTKQIEYILEHEFVHIRRFDAALKLLLTAVLCIHWFNPLVWAMYILSNRDIELSCDEAVVRSFGETTKSTYARTLISMEEKKSTLMPLCNSFSKNAIEERITAIMKLKKTSALATLAAVVLIASVATAFATSAAASESLGIQANTAETDLTVQIKDAPVLIKDTSADKISASYDSSYYKVNINQPSSGEWTVDISVVNSETNESVELSIPKRKYNSVDIKINNGMYSGGSINAARLTANVDNGGLDFSLGENFQGNVNIKSNNSIFHLTSHDNFTNFNAKMTCDNESLASAPDYFDNVNGEYKYSNGTASNVLDVSLRGESVGALVSALNSDSSKIISDEIEKSIAPYVSFGITYHLDAEGQTKFYWNGTQIRGIYDEVTGTWVSNSAGNSTFNATVKELFAVYTDQKLTGLREATAQEQEEWNKIRNNHSNNPIRISSKAIAAGGKISLGSQLLAAGTDCKVLLTFTGGSKLTVLCASTNRATKSLLVESGKAATLQIETDGEYTISIKNDNAYTMDNVNGTIEFIQSSGSQSSNIPPSLNTSTTQTVTYSNVEMRRYEGTDGHPYIHDTKVNETTKKITGYKYGMLAFDKDGNPLKIDWWSLDTEAENTYFYLNETSTEISPAETYDVFGGWSLNYFGTDSSVKKIAYVLYCDKEITFEDGTVWTNPDFDNWRSTYEGKKVDVKILKAYYPYEQTINLTSK